MSEDIQMKEEQENGTAASVAETTATPVPEVSEEAKLAESSAAALEGRETADTALGKEQIEEKAQKFIAKQLYRIIVPSFAAWFDRDSVHEIEKRSLPEFFNDKNRTKTPQVYREYRNFMIDTYRLNPTEYLTITACRRNLAGDVCAIMRVHAFLEQWGLLNYQIDPETRPSIIGAQYTGHFQITLDTPQGLQPFFPQIGSQATTEGKSLSITESKAEAAQDQKTPTGPVNLELRKNIYDSSADVLVLTDESQKNGAGVSRTYNCFTCGEDATHIRYHNLQSKTSTSALCFKHGLFPSNFQSADFVKIEQAQAAGETWTSQETLLLLEGIEMYNDDWEAVAYHVGNRSKEACVMKFLQMPIEDPYLVKKQAQTSNQLALHNGKANPEEFLQDSLNSIKASLANQTANGVAEKANALVKQADSEQQKMVAKIVEAQVQKVDLKLSKLSELEEGILEEKRELEKARLQLYLDRLSLKKQADTVLEKLREAATLTGEEAIEVAQEAAKIAKQNPQVTAVAGESEIRQGVKVPKPTVKPVSMEEPETYKFWSA